VNFKTRLFEWVSVLMFVVCIFFIVFQEKARDISLKWEWLLTED